MSGMFDKKNDKAARKEALTQKEQKERKKKKIIAITITIVFLLLLSVSVVANSAFIRHTLPVLTIDGVDFNTTQFEYFFNSEHMEYVEFANQFQGMFPIPDQNRPLSDQIQNEETGETWADFITDRMFQRLTSTVSLYNAAVAYGFELSQENHDLIDNHLSNREFEALIHGFPNTNSYLQRMFGFSMNERIYREIMEFLLIADSFNLYMLESFEYTPQQLEAFSAENADYIDTITYRLFTVSVDMPFADDFENDEEFEDALEAALAESYEFAQEILSEITDEETFLIAAAEYNPWFADPAATLGTDMAERLSDELSGWLLDGDREAGDVAVLESANGAHVIFFVSRDGNHYRTRTMHQILISRENVNPDDFDEGASDPEFFEALEQAELNTTARALEVYNLFIAGETTEEALIALMAEHSDDTTPDGFYEDIATMSYNGNTFNAMRLVPEIEEWLFYENRVIGDFELIETANFGYHLVMFSGFGDYLSNLIADDRMRAADHEEWHENLYIGQPQKRGAFILVSV